MFAGTHRKNSHPSPCSRQRVVRVSALVLGCAVACPTLGGAKNQTLREPDQYRGGSPASSQWQPGEPRNTILAEGSTITIPLVVSAQETDGEVTSTTFYVANHSDSSTTATFRFRGDDGTDLELPVATDPANAMSSAVDLKSSHDLELDGAEADQVVIRQATPSKAGWAEVTSVPAAPLSVKATTVRTLTTTKRDFNEIDPTPAYRQAWLVVDNTGGYSTDLVLVSGRTDKAQSFHLEFESGDTSCDATVEVPAMGRTTVEISDSLSCSSDLLGTVEVNAAGPFTGIAKVSASEQDDTFIRTLVGFPDMGPTPLEAWTVSEGSVQFEHLSSEGCIDLDSQMLVGVSYTVHDSVWQARADEAAEWADLAGTEKTGSLCAYSPTEPGAYRGVADITIDGIPGLYSSSGTITKTAAPLSVGGYAPIPSFVVSEESVQFGSLSAQCVSSSELIQVDWVSYEIHSSKWQRRDDEDSDWADVDGTAKTGQICAHDPATAGQYRAVAEVSRNGVRGTYVSSNILTEEPPPSSATPTSQSSGEECSTLVGCFIPLPAGSFRMGSDSSDAEDDETPLTQVTIGEGVQIAKYELTHAQWELIMGRPAAYVESDCEETCPISAVAFIGISDIKIDVFMELLNGRDTEFTYRLPTEAEWEYAARAGTTGDRYGNLDDIAWHGGNSNNEIHPIGQKLPNAWGFYDMLGNVYEWVQDYYGDYPGGSVTDPTGPQSGSRRVARGGSYVSDASEARAPNRKRYSPGYVLPHLGFRLARVRR